MLQKTSKTPSRNLQKHHSHLLQNPSLRTKSPLSKALYGSIPKPGYFTHLGDGYLGALVDQLHHIVDLALLRCYQETLRECTHRCRILLAHEAEISRDQSNSSSTSQDRVEKRYRHQSKGRNMSSAGACGWTGNTWGENVRA